MDCWLQEWKEINTAEMTTRIYGKSGGRRFPSKVGRRRIREGNHMHLPMTRGKGMGMHPRKTKKPRTQNSKRDLNPGPAQRPRHHRARNRRWRCRRCPPSVRAGAATARGPATATQSPRCRSAVPRPRTTPSPRRVPQCRPQRVGQPPPSNVCLMPGVVFCFSF